MYSGQGLVHVGGEDEGILQPCHEQALQARDVPKLHLY
jgi:hypothetical protein